MTTGKIKKLVHLSQQAFLHNVRLVPDHNDKGYGILEDEEGRDVFFPHEVVEGRRGFDELRRVQTVEYTLEDEQYLRAMFGTARTHWWRRPAEATATTKRPAPPSSNNCNWPKKTCSAKTQPTSPYKQLRNWGRFCQIK